MAAIDVLPDAGAPLAKSELVYRALHARIVSGGYGPGDRLVLDQIAAEFAVSTVPVREAVRRLEAERLVQFTRYVGAQVLGVRRADYENTMRVLAILEGASTAQSAPLLTERDLQEARALNAQMRELAADFDPSAFARMNDDFHHVLARRCPNTHLRAATQREWDRLTTLGHAAFVGLPERAAESVDEHDSLLEQIASGSLAIDIELAVRAHVIATMERFLAARPDDESLMG